MNLQNKTILVTRPREQASEFILEIEKRGGRAVLFPTVQISDPSAEGGWDDCDKAIEQISNYHGLLFTSANGVEKFLHRCFLKKVDLQSLHRLRIYAVGEKTKHAIERHGLKVHFVPEKFSGSSLAEHFTSAEVQDRKFLFPRGNIGREELVERLQKLGAQIDPIIVYKTEQADSNGAETVWKLFADGKIDIVTFTSPSAAVNFAKMIPLGRFAEIPKHPKIAVIGPTTEQAVRDLGFTADIVAKDSTIIGLLDAIAAYDN